jgi:hypothetical protein
MKNVDPRPWTDNIVFGRIPNTRVWEKLGYNGAVGNTTEDIWELGGTYPWLAAAAGLEVVGGAADTVAGAGVQQVQIEYLDASYVEKSTIVTMTGAVAAPTPALDIFRIQHFCVYRTGANGLSASQIVLRSLGGGTTRSVIAAGYTLSRSSAWTVPAGKTLYITSLAVSCGSDTPDRNTLVTMRANYDDSNDRVLTPLGVFFMPFFEVLLEDLSLWREMEVPIKLPATVDLKISGLADSNSAMCASAMRGFVATGVAP